MAWDGIEKRRFVRANFPCKIIIYLPQEHSLMSHTEDIGAGGLRVIIKEELELSLIVGLEIFLNGEPIICKGRVVWNIEREKESSKDKNRYDTGIEFYEIKEEDRRVIDNLVEAIISGQK